MRMKGAGLSSAVAIGCSGPRLAPRFAGGCRSWTRPVPEKLSNADVAQQAGRYVASVKSVGSSPAVGLKKFGLLVAHGGTAGQTPPGIGGVMVSTFSLKQALHEDDGSESLSRSKP